LTAGAASRTLPTSARVRKRPPHANAKARTSVGRL